jgi:hypothetical protein
MANVVKGSKQQAMMVVPYRRWYRTWVSISIILALLAVALGGYFYGYFEASRLFSVTSADNARLSASLLEARDEVESLRSEVAIAGRSNLVDQRATEEVQSTVSSLRERIMQLEQDVSFYRQVMSPGSDELGIIIAEFDVTPMDGAGRYHYKAVFRQAGAGDRVLEGKVQIDIAGRLDDQRQVLSLATILLEGRTFDPALNFRYFQNLEGEFILPEGFVPEQVEVKAESSKPTAIKVEKIFSWSVVEV